MYFQTCLCKFTGSVSFYNVVSVAPVFLLLESVGNSQNRGNQLCVYEQLFVPTSGRLYQSQVIWIVRFVELGYDRKMWEYWLLVGSRMNREVMKGTWFDSRNFQIQNQHDVSSITDAQ